MIAEMYNSPSFYAFRVLRDSQDYPTAASQREMYSVINQPELQHKLYSM